MSASCPHCQKELDGFVPQKTMDERLRESSEKRKQAESRASELEALAKQASALGARAYGYEDDAEILQTLQARFDLAKKAEAPYSGDFIAWLGDPAGAQADKVAARFRAATPPATPAKVEPPASPKSEAKPTANSTATVAPTPPVQARLTPQQVAELNRPLLQERGKLKMAQKPTTEIDAKIAANKALLQEAPVG